MRYNQILSDLLKRDEGFRSYAYRDPLGYWTIGYGRLIDRAKGGGISTTEAEYLLNNDIHERQKIVEDLMPWVAKLDTVRHAIIISMAFQLGINGLMSFRNTLKAVREGRYNDAAEGMLASKWAQQTPGRVFRLAEAMRTGDQAAFRLSEDL